MNTSASAIEVPWERIERFVGRLTHDVRNGLNALELQLTFLGEISTDPEAVEEVKRIRRTVSDITRQLQAVSIATGAAELNILDYPARDFFEDLQERFEKKHPADRDRLEWKIDVGEAAVSIDPEATMAALLELIANALHFGTPGSKLIIGMSLAADHAVLTLLQTTGEPPAVPVGEWGLRPLVATRRGAYGLGLFRARRVLEAQGGSFNAVHSADEQQLTMTVTLPVSRRP